MTHSGALPNKRSSNAAEMSLGQWLSKALQRRRRALSDRPSQRQLTPEETAHLDSIVGMAMGAASANVPAPSHARPSVAFQGDAVAEARMQVENDAGGHRQAELAPDAPSKRRTKRPRTALGTPATVRVPPAAGQQCPRCHVGTLVSFTNSRDGSRFLRCHRWLTGKRCHFKADV